MISISVHGLDALRRGLKHAPQYTREALLVAMHEATKLLQSESVDAMPSVSGDTRDSVFSDAFSTPAGVLGVVGSASVAAVALELGRKPGKGVSKDGQEAIAKWAQAKLGVSPAKARGIAFMTSQKYKAHGHPAQRPFGKTWDRQRGYITRLFEDVASDVATKLANDVLGGAT